MLYYIHEINLPASINPHPELVLLGSRLGSDKYNNFWKSLFCFFNLITCDKGRGHFYSFDHHLCSNLT